MSHRIRSTCFARHFSFGCALFLGAFGASGCSSGVADRAQRGAIERDRIAAEFTALYGPPRSRGAEAGDRAEASRTRFDGAGRADVVGRSLLMYEPRWTRAEDLEVTLAPLLQSLYGPNARVLSHTGTNRLSFYIPPREERERAAATPGASRGTPTPARRR